MGSHVGFEHSGFYGEDSVWVRDSRELSWEAVVVTKAGIDGSGSDGASSRGGGGRLEVSVFWM